MRVGHEHVGDGFPRQRREQGRDMRLIRGTWVDDRHLTPPHDIGAGARVGEGTGVVRDDPAHQG